MATPPDSENLFFSSSPTRYSSGPSEEVEVLLAQAQKVEQLSPAVVPIFSANRFAFLETFSRRVELIKSRSQALEDFHVTVFDKVLLALTQNGNKLDNPAAITYFCEEFLGISRNTIAAQQKATLSSAITVPMALDQVMNSPPETRHGSISTTAAGSKSPEKNVNISQAVEEKKMAALAELASQVGPAMTHLWGIYAIAKSEFFAITDTASLERQKAAKFLRDTAENAIHSLQNKNGDRRLVEELDMTLDIAKHTAMTLHGGKKRKFDDPRQGHEGAAVATRVSQPAHNGVARTNTGPDRRLHATYGNARNGGFSSGHSRAFVDPRRSGSGGFAKDSSARFVAPDLSPRDTRVEKRKKKQPGRGHSGIPFGYTRPVDSYYPG